MSNPAYIIFNVNVIDSEQYDKYRVYSGQAMKEYGAEVLVRGGVQTILEGAPYSRTVVLKFPSILQAQAFYDSETYKKGRELRKEAAIANVIIVEGVA